MKIHNRWPLKKIRRKLRKKETEAEELFWQRVRNKKVNGLKFKRQHSICNNIVDFYCPSKKIIIELDGEYHDTEQQNIKDKLRDEHLQALGFKILRFRNEKILFHLNQTIDILLNTIKNSNTNDQ